MIILFVGLYATYSARRTILVEIQIVEIEGLSFTVIKLELEDPGSVESSKITPSDIYAIQLISYAINRVFQLVVDTPIVVTTYWVYIDRKRR